MPHPTLRQPNAPTTARTRKPLHKHLLLAVIAAAAVSACGGSDTPEPQARAKLQLERIGGYNAGVFLESAAEITTFDPATQRGFVVNAMAGAVDVLDLSDPTQPKKLQSLDATLLRSGASINSVAVHGGLVAAAVQDADKTQPGFVALYHASSLQWIKSVSVGALPDMLTFTPDGKTLLVANEGEPSDNYQYDPEGSISVIDVSDPTQPTVRTADFHAFNAKKADLIAKGVRIYGPGASVAQDLEPEYIAVAPDGKTAWASLQENNALAIIDVASATITDVVPLGYKDHGLAANALDFSDNDGKQPVIDITTAPGVHGMYQPDAIAAYQAQDGQTYIVTANEGDARAWGEDNANYFGSKDTVGDPSQGFVEEWRVKHLVHPDGFMRRAGDDLPAHLGLMASGAQLNPDVFSWCTGGASQCREDNNLGRLKISWTMGYQTHADGSPKLDAARMLTYDKLYAYGARSISIWDAQGQQVWDSGAAMEQFLASDACKLGTARDIPCAPYFNTGHDEKASLDARSTGKGPEPEGLAVGRIGAQTFAFVGLERMGGVMMFDITRPAASTFVDYLNPRANWDLDIEAILEDSGLNATQKALQLEKAGDLGPEGLHFIAADDSPNGKPLLMVGNEVSGTTAIYQINLSQ